MSPEFPSNSDDQFLAAMPEAVPYYPSHNPDLDKWMRTRSYNVLEPTYRDLLIKMPEYRKRLEDMNKWYHANYTSWGMVGEITDQVRFYKHDTWEERRDVMYTDDEASQLIVDLAQAKKQETDWAMFYGSPETPGEDVVRSLDSFWEWLGSVNAWYPNDSYKVGSQIFLMPSALKPLMFDAVLKAMEANPALVDQATASFVRLNEIRQASTEKEGRIYGVILGGLENMLYKAGHFSGEERKVQNDNRIDLLSRMTDAGLIRETTWYKIGVRDRGELSNFDFLDTLRGRLAENGDEVRTAFRHKGYFNDAIFLAERVIGRMAETDGRNQQIAQALLGKLTAMKREGINSPRDFIILANTVSPIIDHFSGEEAVEKLSLEVKNMPQAFMRLLYVTRNLTASEEIAADQEYEDEVYGDLLSFAVSRAINKHEKWFIASQLEGQNESKIILRYAWRDNTYRTGVHKWRKGARRGRAILRR